MNDILFYVYVASVIFTTLAFLVEDPAFKKTRANVSCAVRNTPTVPNTEAVVELVLWLSILICVLIPISNTYYAIKMLFDIPKVYGKKKGLK